MMKRSLGLELRKYRKTAGLTLQELAERVGVSKQCVYFWEHGIREPGVDRLWALANALAVNVDSLITLKLEQGM